MFTTEAAALRSTAAVEAEAAIDPGEGVDVRRVIDRGSERRGRKIVVPLGGFAKGEVKTVLVEIDVPTRAEGPMSVASVEVGYRDLTRGERARSKGMLGLYGFRGKVEQPVLLRVAAGLSLIPPPLYHRVLSSPALP